MCIVSVVFPIERRLWDMHIFGGYSHHVNHNIGWVCVIHMFTPTEETAYIERHVHTQTHILTHTDTPFR